MSEQLSNAASLLSYPPSTSLVVIAVGVAAIIILRRRRIGAALIGLALAWSLLWSIPVASEWLRGTLESRYRIVDERELPRADAIVVLGGATRYGWMQRARVDPWELGNSRLAAGARAWLSERAPFVILSGGGAGRDGSEAARMRGAIVRLGVRDDAIVLEERSLNTEENALNTARIAHGIGARRILLVTSSLHMPRAMTLFERTGLEVVPVPVPERAVRTTLLDKWMPSRSALWRSGRALKEYVALAVLALGHERATATL